MKAKSKSLSFEVLENISEIFTKNNKILIPLSSLIRKFPKTLLKNLGLSSSTRVSEFHRAIEPHVKNQFCFYKKGFVIYIAPDISPVELIWRFIGLATLQGSRSLKKLQLSSPFYMNKFVSIINQLAISGRICVTLDENFSPKVSLTDKQRSWLNNVNKAPVINAPDIIIEQYNSYQEVSPENFMSAFDELDHGKIFVRICDLRKKLNWSRENFDRMLVKLRDEAKIQLHEGDVTLMTDDEIENCFIDENNFRMGTVIRNDR